MIKAAIVVVGSEILRGVVQDTNSHWLASRLTELGFEVVRIVVVPDDYESVEWAVHSSLEIADVVVTTGGLGFTEDDITVPAVARALGLELQLSQEAVEYIRRRVGGEPTYQLKAAYVPKGGKPLYNPAGVSPGVYLRIGGKHVFMLPGVPLELKAVFENEVVQILETIPGRRYVKRVEVLTLHEREAEVDHLLKPLREKFRNVYFKTHASKPVKLSIIVVASTQSELENLLGKVLEDLKQSIRVQSVEL
ncbi:MAG: competence/damage-inducible protein A [Desulfurococcaceae archaeon]